MRYNDVRHRTNKVEPILQKYKNAWEKKGMITFDGLYVSWLSLTKTRSCRLGISALLYSEPSKTAFF